jgi:hypothetical protein
LEISFVPGLKLILWEVSGAETGDGNAQRLPCLLGPVSSN